jgi:DNA-binding PadR family transcriptional regulator
LHRLEAAGRLGSRWGPSENNRRAKYYKLTAAGRKQLDVETGNWKRIVVAMSFALET